MAKLTHTEYLNWWNDIFLDEINIKTCSLEDYKEYSETLSTFIEHEDELIEEYNNSLDDNELLAWYKNNIIYEDDDNMEAYIMALNWSLENIEEIRKLKTKAEIKEII